MSALPWVAWVALYDRDDETIAASARCSARGIRLALSLAQTPDRPGCRARHCQPPSDSVCSGERGRRSAPGSCGILLSRHSEQQRRRQYSCPRPLTPLPTRMTWRDAAPPQTSRSHSTSPQARVRPPNSTRAHTSRTTRAPGTQHARVHVRPRVRNLRCALPQHGRRPGPLRHVRQRVPARRARRARVLQRHVRRLRHRRRPLRRVRHGVRRPRRRGVLLGRVRGPHGEPGALRLMQQRMQHRCQ